MPNNIVFGFLLVGACLASASARSSDSRTGGEDAAQVRTVVSSFAKAWNDHDMEALSRLFTQDADWVNIRGNRWIGIGQISKQHDAIHRLFFSSSRLEFADVSVRMITPDVAVIHARETITGSNMPKPPA